MRKGVNSFSNVIFEVPAMETINLKTWEEFEWRDNIELSWGLGNAIALADYMIDNSGSLEDLHKNIDELMKKITG